MEIHNALRPVLHYAELESVLKDFQGSGFKLIVAIKDEQSQIIWASLSTPCGRGHFMLAKDPEHRKDRAKGVVLYCMLPADMTADKAYDHFRGLGFPMVEALGDRYWGDRTFTFEDQGGYRWTIAQSIPDYEVALPAGYSLMEGKTPALV